MSYSSPVLFGTVVNVTTTMGGRWQVGQWCCLTTH